MSQEETSTPAPVELLLSSKPTLRQKQLEVYGMMVHGTNIGMQVPRREDFNQSRIKAWNSIPAAYRNNPVLIKVALGGHQYFERGHRASISIDTINTRCGMMTDLIKVKLSDDSSNNLLSYIGKHHKMIQDCFTYDRYIMVERMKAPNFTWDGVEYQQNNTFDVKTVGQEILDLHGNIIQICRWFTRIHTRRNHWRTVDARNSGNMTLGQRFNHMLQNITSVRPHRWNTSLTSSQATIANRLRPSGECLGIELEFVATAGSDIVSWDHEDYPVHPWLYFKGDGSIRPNRDSEQLAQYQELTWFINGSSSNDWKNMEQVLKSMTANGAGVNNSCGNHVHIDMRHRSAQSAMRTASKIRDAINTWAHRTVSFTRAHNTYCGIDREHQGNRYTAVNTQCISEHQTVEVRLGMPTLNFYKLKYWCAFMQYLAKPYTSVGSLEEFMESDADIGLKHYVFKRILKFESTYLNHNIQSLPNFANYAKAFQSIDNGVE